MLTIRAMALRHVLQAGMNPSMATRFLERFSRTTAGKGIAWDEEARRLPEPLEHEIDKAALGFAMNPSNQVLEPTETRQPHDGKMAALGKDA